MVRCRFPGSIFSALLASGIVYAIWTTHYNNDFSSSNIERHQRKVNFLSQYSIVHCRQIGLCFQASEDARKNSLDGCYHVYLDIGTNVGLQIRKLYQQELYPEAKINPYFKKFFGPTKKRRQSGHVCAVGFEPNPQHTEVLKGRLVYSENRFA